MLGLQSRAYSKRRIVARIRNEIVMASKIATNDFNLWDLWKMCLIDHDVNC